MSEQELMERILRLERRLNELTQRGGYAGVDNLAGLTRLWQDTEIVGDLNVKGATTVQNLTINGSHSLAGVAAFTTYWTCWSGTQPAIGNGTLSGTYSRVGRLYLANIYWKAGSTTTFGTGDWAFYLPVMHGLANQIGPVWFVDAGATFGHGIARTVAGSQNLLLTGTAGLAYKYNHPHTWAVNDELSIQIAYMSN